MSRALRGRREGGGGRRKRPADGESVAVSGEKEEGEKEKAGPILAGRDQDRRPVPLVRGGKEKEKRSRGHRAMVQEKRKGERVDRPLGDQEVLCAAREEEK